MPLQCRTCAGVIYNTNAKNLFDIENSEILIDIEMITGTALVKDAELPAHICACCLLDLKRAVVHTKMFRERCMKTQERLLNTLEIMRNASQYNNDNQEYMLSNVKEEAGIDYEEFSIKSNVDDDLIECEDEDSVNDNNTIEDTAQDVDSLITSVRNEMRSLYDYSSDSQETSDQDRLQVLSDNDSSPDDEFMRLPSFKDDDSKNCKKLPAKNSTNNINSSSKQGKKTYVSWKNLTEEQIIERKRQQRRRDCICDQCGRHFTDQSNFKLHLLRHTGIKNFKCKYCSKDFYTEHLLQLHERIVHMGERPYGCKYCDQTFHNSTTRVIHERSHTNERPYSCEHCSKSFISASGLKRHELSHNGIRAFYCSTCDKTFQRKTHLKAHLRSKLHALRQTNTSLLSDL